MCGIAGMFLYKRGDLQHGYFSWCLETMKRRGPDSQKVWHNNHNYIASFARLAIRDLTEHGDQPMLSDCHNYCISFNGEIYNTAEILQLLRPFRTEFRSTSDTEVLLYALIHLGIDRTLLVADGMFAFAFFDAQNEKLILARDRAGVKPLYIGTGKYGVVYSSQYDHIINHPFFTNECLNPGAVACSLSLGYMGENSGVIHNTFLMPHGYYIVAQNGRTESVNYYSYPVCSSFSGQDLDDVLGQSVIEQLVSDVPLGSFMSGGVDSNLVSYFANRQRKLHSFTIGLDDHGMNEADQADSFASIFNTDHHCRYMTSGDMLALIKENSLAFTEPFADYSSLPTLFLSKFAREKITVALSGDGGDELFFGYPRNLRALKVIPLYRKKMLTRKFRLLANKLRNPTFDLSRHWAYASFPEYYYSTLHITGALYWIPQICRIAPDKSFYYLQSEELYEVDNSTERLMNIIRKMEVDIHLQRILLKVDRASMHYGLEVRVPFLNNSMLRFSTSCRYSDCIKHAQGKMVLKHSLADKTTAGMVFQPKKGFTIPLDKWIRETIKSDVTEKIMDMPAHLSGLFYRDKLSRLLTEHMEGKADWGWIIWSLYSFVNWDATHRNKYRPCA